MAFGVPLRLLGDCVCLPLHLLPSFVCFALQKLLFSKVVRLITAIVPWGNFLGSEDSDSHRKTTCQAFGIETRRQQVGCNPKVIQLNNLSSMRQSKSKKALVKTSKSMSNHQIRLRPLVVDSSGASFKKLTNH